ncbi:Wzz/FepE/Etk N-terminal domain-containing protein [Gallaecimonas kandeliae]|nr:Wzz/FepE/Etk N-terminal domain-containing protein [Gallaecimonas kandeliae]WKE67448.1 Wzz/FepE/Etk N-terminal domain-containing protein [Gallaecimonas kandeliae]
MKDADFPAQQGVPHPGYLPARDDEIDLRELFAAIWAGKWMVLIVTFIFALGSVAIALYLPNVYKSEALVAPADSDQKGGLAGLASQFGGLASLAGINLGGSTTDKTALALQVLKSRDFIGHFIDRHQLLVPLMAAKGWDRSSDQLKLDGDIYDAQAQEWVRKAKLPFKSKPSAQEAYKKFVKDVLVTSQDKESGMVTIATSFYSPELAQQWTAWLVQDLNEVMRQRDMAEAKKSIRYLENQINKTNLADLKSMLYQLVEEQTKTLMFAEVRDEYVFKTVDPAIVPEEKDKPKRALICILGIMLGGMLGVASALIRYFMRKE